ncbi:MAG TPA: chaperone modulator CbpM [Noviherbaspirillum sp.]|jgi:chaperone modulatory protein CbpM|uniref:chaperone modulator CbpM n=1 Tax=Noviherbaspirillum sp. TaxID=1926288 RepID=UPI002DDCA8E6|nr:chaperone modulator CbpM [Noviherbaspirillum sp.]HEV2610952.1 chaperone modulator CbpM [Noviherbaspirillum sp.]
MMKEHIALILDDARLTLDEVAASCTVSREWVIEHVQAGVLLGDTGSDPDVWLFNSRDVLRARRVFELERRFDANPELAGLVADLLDELERLRARVRHAGLRAD